MISLPEDMGGVMRRVASLFKFRIDRGRIGSVETLREFVSTRAAYIAQTTLFTYVKRRMGVRYPAMFHEPLLMDSLNIAKMQCFAACLSDLTIFCVAAGTHGQPMPNEERAALAAGIYKAALLEGAEAGSVEKFSPQESIDVFMQRAAAADWAGKARRPEIFSESVTAIVRWAPIAEELKKLDREIVGNSIKFAWRDIREQFGKRIDGAALYADWQNRAK